MSNHYYAVAKGRNPGIYSNWDDCRAEVHQYSGAAYKKFESQSAAENFIRNSSSGTTSQSRAQSSYYEPSSYSGTSENSYSGGGYYSGGSSKPRTDNRYYEQKSQPRSLDDYIPLRITKTTTRTFSTGGGYQSDKGKQDFSVDGDGYVDVYTDGACSSNGYKNAKGGIGVWFGPDHSSNVSKPVAGPATNNRAEIQAATEAMKQAKKAGITKLTINTDSKFLIDSATEWMPQWKNNNWKRANNEPVINKNELLDMDKELRSMDVKWKHVAGHAGNHGNEMADKLAREGSLQYNKH